MSYSRDLIDDLLQASDIVDVISSYIPVISKGRSYLAVCPFHDDKNPSLNISKEKQIFKCFSCGTGGNALTFVQKYEKISFDEAVRKLAQIVGFEDPRLISQKKEKAINTDLVPLYKCINDLQLFYQYGLSTEEGLLAKEYLSKRNIDQKDIETFSIGYSLADGTKTIQYLQAKGHSLKSIEDIGIALARLSGASDSNASRLIFPLKDSEGQVVGFSARRIKDDDTAKYVNSPETRIFQKSKVLYNYHLAKETARHDGYIYVLEGFMDVIALNKAGIQSAVALMGTNMSDEHIQMIRRLKVEVRLCLDGDAAGQEGMMKIINKLSKNEIPFRIVNNPGDLRDPDDILQESGPEALKEAMNHLVDPFQFQLNYYLNFRKLVTQEERKKVLMHFIPFLRSVPAGLERNDYITKVADATGYSRETIRDEVNAKPLVRNNLENDSFDSVNFEEVIKFKDQKRNRLEKAERQILYYMLNNSEAVAYFKDKIDSFYEPVYQTIANFILEYELMRKTKLEVSLLILDIASSGNQDSEKIEQEVSEIAEEDMLYPPYKEENIELLARCVREEKEKIHEKQTTNEELIGKRQDERAEILNQRLASLRKKKRK